MKKKSHRQIKKEAYWERQRQNKRLRRDLLFLSEVILLVCVICDVATNGNAHIVTSVLQKIAFISVAGYVIFVASIVIAWKKERLWRGSSDTKDSSGKGDSTRGLQAAVSTDDKKKESVDTLLQAGLIDKEEYDQRLNRIKRNS